MAMRIQLRRGTSAEWTSANPVLAEGEAGLETDTGNVKYGDGVRPWAELPYSVALPGPGEVIVGSADGPVARDIGELGPGGVPVGSDAVENVSVIQQAIDAATPGSTVRLPPGVDVAINGTIHVRSRITLDLNGSTLRAVDNAAFAPINLGLDPQSGETYHPESIKAVVALIGEEGNRLQGASVVNGTIDGNGTNQPDEGAYANVAVFLADDSLVDVTSLRARPGITINPSPGVDSRKRAFCLFVGNAARTTVHGTYIDAGYDAIGLRSGATDTTLSRVVAGKATRGSVQVAGGARRTRITDSLIDNTEGDSDTSHSLYLHSAKGLVVSNTTLINGGDAPTGSPFHAFGDTNRGASEDVVLSNVQIVHDQNTPLFHITTPYVERLTASDITFKKTGTQAVIQSTGGAKGLTFERWKGTAESASNAVYFQGAFDVDLLDCDMVSGSTGNPMMTLTSVTRLKVRGGSYKNNTGPAAVCTTSADVTFDGVRFITSDSVQALGGNTNIDVINCDLSRVTNANKLRIYGPDSGLVRGNRGMATEANGTATVLAAATSVTIPHGLWAGTGTTGPTPRTDRLWLPQDFQVSFAGDPGSASKVWVSAVTPTQVTFTVDAAPGTDVSLAWSAAMNRRTQP